MKKKVKTKDKKRKGGKGKIIFLVILLILLIAGGIFGYNVYQKGFLKTILGSEDADKLPKMYCVILGKSQNLTDTIILASYDPKTQEAAMLSIPRDTFIGESKSSASSWDKINAVYQTEDGPQKVLEHVRDLTGIDVRYYLMVDTAALKALVDEIGGVTFKVPIDMNYDDRKQDLHIHLEKGEQLLDGDKAEQVVRFRHNNNGSTYPESYGIEDIGRMRTQREFLKALAKQTLVPANLLKIPGFIDIAKTYVETNLDFDAIKDYVPYAVEFNTDNLKSDKLPGTPEYANVVWIYSVDEDETEKVVNKLFFAQPENAEDPNSADGEGSESGIDRSSVNLEVLNGSGSSTNLSEVVADLKAAGYKVSKTGKTTTTSKTTIINRDNVSNDISEDIKKILDIGSVTSGQASGDTDITIILGTDYIV